MGTRARVFALLALAGCGGEKARPTSHPAPVETAPVYLAVETVAPEAATAGTSFRVQCLLVDGAGEPVAPTVDQKVVVILAPESSVARSGNEITALRAGQVAAACQAPDLGLADRTPSLVRIDPGAPAAVETHLSRDEIAAGEDVQVTCTGVDAQGNAVDVAAGVLVAPAGEGVRASGATVHAERAGLFEVSCDVPGASATTVRLLVHPGLPASLAASLSPPSKVHARGEIVEVRTVVADRYGNPVDGAPVSVTASGGENLAEGHLRFPEDGRFRVDVRVAPPTFDDEPLTATLEVRVDSSAPAVACVDPPDGAILDAAPGTSLTFHGRVQDATGVARVVVSGVQVPVMADGSFTRTLTAAFGVNAVDLSAVDVNGHATTATCSFLSAGTYAVGDLPGAISLRLGPSAIDDGARTAPPGSLGDILQAALSSSALHDTLDASLKAANPVKASSCDQQACVFGLCTCVLRSQVDYVAANLSAGSSVRLALAPGGMTGRITFTRPALQLRVRGQVAGISYDTTGWATFSQVTVDLAFDLALTAGRPRMSVRPGTVTTNVGTLSTDFSGIDGAVIDIVASLASGTLRNAVRDQITAFVRDGFDALLDGVFSGLDVSSLGFTTDVPRPGGGTLPLTMGVSFSGLDVTADRALFGLSTRFTAPAAQARPSRGVPLPPGDVLLDPGGAGLAVSLHVGLLAQAMHALWRAGFFDAQLGGDAGPGLPADLDARLAVELPPAVEVIGDRVHLGLGAVQLQLALPALLGTPVDGRLAARVSLGISLKDGKLVFGGVRVEELHFATQSVDLDETTRDTLVDLLSRILGQLVGQALQGALPSFPLPSFALPEAATGYGLPAGAALQLVNPVLTIPPQHFTVSGGSEIR